MRPFLRQIVAIWIALHLYYWSLIAINWLIR